MRWLSDLIGTKQPFSAPNLRLTPSAAPTAVPGAVYVDSSLNCVRVYSQARNTFTSPANKYVIQLSQGLKSTSYDSATKLALGAIQFDPSSVEWALSSNTQATLHMLLETTNASNAACGELFFVPTSGAPSVVATTPTTTSLTAYEVTVDVSAAFRPSASSGTFFARAWITTNNGADYAGCAGAWIEIQL